jgi:hypothetical protein
MDKTYAGPVTPPKPTRNQGGEKEIEINMFSLKGLVLLP